MKTEVTCSAFLYAFDLLGICRLFPYQSVLSGNKPNSRIMLSVKFVFVVLNYGSIIGPPPKKNYTLSREKESNLIFKAVGSISRDQCVFAWSDIVSDQASVWSDMISQTVHAHCTNTFHQKLTWTQTGCCLWVPCVGPSYKLLRATPFSGQLSLYALSYAHCGHWQIGG